MINEQNLILEILNIFRSIEFFFSIFPFLISVGIERKVCVQVIPICNVHFREISQEYTNIQCIYGISIKYLHMYNHSRAAKSTEILKYFLFK